MGTQYSRLARAESDRLSHLSNARGLRRVLERRRDQWEMSSLLRQERWSLTGNTSPDPFPASMSNGERHAAIAQLVQASLIKSNSDIRGEAAACLAFPDAEVTAFSKRAPQRLRSLFPVANGKSVFAASHSGLITWKTDGTDLNLESSGTSSGTVERTPISVSAWTTSTAKTTIRPKAIPAFSRFATWSG